MTMFRNAMPKPRQSIINTEAGNLGWIPRFSAEAVQTKSYGAAGHLHYGGISTGLENGNARQENREN